MRGQMPNFIMNSRAVGTLAILMGMRRKFDQSDEIDQSRRNNLSGVRNCEERSDELGMR